MTLRLSCKQAAGLMVAREDRPLGLGERLALRIHLAHCRTCPHFDAQMRTLRTVLERWRSQPDGDNGAPDAG